MADLKTIALSEVAEHNTHQSCWIIMDGKVYDVSKFLSEHPGGEEVIAELAGKDASDAFRDVGHSKDALEMAKEYLIGKVPESASTAKSPSSTTGTAVAPSPINGATSFKEIMLSPTWTNFFIPSAIGIVVYVLYKGALRMIA